jgi:hypothetical protein
MLENIKEITELVDKYNHKIDIFSTRNKTSLKRQTMRVI